MSGLRAGSFAPRSRRTPFVGIGRKSFRWPVVITLALVPFVALGAGFLISLNDRVASFFGSSIVAVIGCASAVLGFFLACFWLLFPILIVQILNRMQKTLELIEQNGRR